MHGSLKILFWENSSLAYATKEASFADKLILSSTVTAFPGQEELMNHLFYLFRTTVD
jgi:hypothetical protein